MSDPQRETDSSPYSRPPLRSAAPTSEKTQNAIVAGAAGVALATALAGYFAYRSVATEPRPLPALAEPVAAESASMPMPRRTPAPVEQAPAPQPAPLAPDPKARLKSCRPYAGFVADQQNPAVSDAVLADEAECLCSLAGGFTVRNPGGGLQVYKRVSACPSGSHPLPLEPDAKVWMGQWIDEPGHGACACSESVRAMKVVFAR